MTKMTDTAATAAIGAATRELRLPVVRTDAARLAEIAQRSQQSYLAFLAEVLSAEVDERSERRRQRRVTEARFPRIKRLADFDLAAAPTINPATIATLASCAYLDAGEPVVLLGDSGTGKSHLLIGFGLAACEQGRRVRYATAAQLVNELAEAADERRLSRIVARYGRLDLLCLDELGYVQLDARGSELLFQILTEREEKASARSRRTCLSASGARSSPSLASSLPSSTDSHSTPTSSRPAPRATGSASLAPPADARRPPEHTNARTLTPRHRPRSVSSQHSSRFQVGPNETSTLGPIPVDIPRHSRRCRKRGVSAFDPAPMRRPRPQEQEQGCHPSRLSGRRATLCRR
jgi:DNA replication protein DnaC